MKSVGKEKRRYTLTLEADARPHDAEGTMRLKRLLKALLRVYALRAIEVTEIRTEPTRDQSNSHAAACRSAGELSGNVDRCP